MKEFVDYYQVLGVQPWADTVEIRGRLGEFGQLSELEHEAIDSLSNPERRRLHDLELAERVASDPSSRVTMRRWAKRILGEAGQGESDEGCRRNSMTDSHRRLLLQLAAQSPAGAVRDAFVALAEGAEPLTTIGRCLLEAEESAVAPAVSGLGVSLVDPDVAALVFNALLATEDERALVLIVNALHASERAALHEEFEGLWDDMIQKGLFGDSAARRPDPDRKPGSVGVRYLEALDKSAFVKQLHAALVRRSASREDLMLYSAVLPHLRDYQLRDGEEWRRAAVRILMLAEEGRDEQVGVLACRALAASEHPKYVATVVAYLRDHAVVSTADALGIIAAFGISGAVSLEVAVKAKPILIEHCTDQERRAALVKVVRDSRSACEYVADLLGVDGGIYDHSTLAKAVEVALDVR